MTTKTRKLTLEIPELGIVVNGELPETPRARCRCGAILRKSNTTGLCGGCSVSVVDTRLAHMEARAALQEEQDNLRRRPAKRK